MYINFRKLLRAVCIMCLALVVGGAGALMAGKVAGQNPESALARSFSAIANLGQGEPSSMGATSAVGKGDSQDLTLANADGNWGLSFQEEGIPPVGNATMDYLAKYNAYYAVATDKKIAYLTFDGGYENGHTEKILDVLKEEKVPAAFFLVGNYFTEEPEIVKRMADEGHIVGNHTMTHPDMSAISDIESFKSELTQVETLYEKITGEKMQKLYRPPQGKYSETNLAQAKELGYTTVFWSLAYVDWLQDQQPTKEEAFSKLLPRMHNGAIILLHSTSKTNAEILGDYIKKCKEEGYTFLPLSKLF